MRIFTGALIIILSVILFMLPITRAVYDYRTDIRMDSFNYETGGAVTVANVSLHDPVYDDDTDTISILSDLATDIPLFSAYNTTTRLVDMTGLTAAANRTLRVYYDIDALSDHTALNTFISWIPLIWILLVSIFPIAGFYLIISGAKRMRR